MFMPIPTPAFIWSGPADCIGGPIDLTNGYGMVIHDHPWPSHLWIWKNWPDESKKTERKNATDKQQHPQNNLNKSLKFIENMKT